MYRDGAFLAQVHAPQTLDADNGVGGGTVHSYAVSALDNAGNQSARSASASVNTPSCGPPPGSYRWSSVFSGSTWLDNVTPQAVAAGGNGVVAVTGYFTGTVDLGSGPMTSAGSNDIFVAAYAAPDGRPLWSRHFGASAPDFGSGVAVDGSGNVVVTGGFQGTVDFGSGPVTSAGNYDVFVARFSSSGAPLWSKRLGGTGDDYAKAVAVDSVGNVAVTGVFSNSVDFGTGALTSAGNYDIFVATYGAANGTPLWSRRAGSVDYDIPYAIAVAPNGNVAVTGVFSDTVDFGGGPLRSAGAYDIFVAQYAGTNGAHLWSKRFGSANADYGTGIAIDASGNVLITGEFDGTVDFGGGPLTNVGAPDIYLVKLSATGVHLWSKSFGTDTVDAEVSTAVAVDASNNVLLAGNIIDAVDFGGGPLPYSGGYDPFVAKFSPAGTHVWSKRFPSASYAYNYSGGVAADASGDAIAAGSFTGTIDLGNGPRTVTNGPVNRTYDGFLVELAP